MVACLVVATVGCREKKSAPRGNTAEQLEGMKEGEEREFGDGLSMKMHRLQAVNPIGDGWHRAVSTEGGFEVELPLPFNDFRTTGKTEDGVILRSHSVGAKSEGLVAWSATCLVRDDGNLGPKAPPPGTDTTAPRGTPPKAVIRNVQLDDRACVLVVEAQGTEPLPDSTTRDRFLRSFKKR